MNEDDSLWIDHISDYSTTITLDSFKRSFSTKPFIIKNLLPKYHQLKMQIGGNMLSYTGAEFNFSDIYLYKLKTK